MVINSARMERSRSPKLVRRHRPGRCRHQSCPRHGIMPPDTLEMSSAVSWRMATIRLANENSFSVLEFIMGFSTLRLTRTFQTRRRIVSDMSTHEREMVHTLSSVRARPDRQITQVFRLYEVRISEGGRRESVMMSPTIPIWFSLGVPGSRRLSGSSAGPIRVCSFGFCFCTGERMPPAMVSETTSA